MSPPFTGSTYSGNLLRFAPGSTGNIAPTFSLIEENSFNYGIAVDAAQNVFVASDQSANGKYYGFSSVIEYSFTGNNDINTVRNLGGTGPPVTYLGDVKVDSVGNVYTIN